MRAIIIDEKSPERTLRCEAVAEPNMESSDLLVAVRAAGVNRADLRRAATHFSASGQVGPPIAGLELAGEVVATGVDVSGFAVGDRVMAMAGGAFAERAAVDYRLAVHVPDSMTWEAAAATPVSFITAHDALIRAAAFRAGESAFIQGASTGAGIAVVQIARLRGAASIVGTAGTPEKRDRLQSLGCDVTIDYRENDPVSVIRKQIRSFNGIDVTIDFAGGDTLRKSIDLASVRGRIVCAGRVAGSDAAVNLDEFSRKQIQMTGVTFRTRSMHERISAVRSFCVDVLPALERGTLGPVIDSVYALQDVTAAQQHMGSNKHFGKIVLMI